jgi:hypothetical protein
MELVRPQQEQVCRHDQYQDRQNRQAFREDWMFNHGRSYPFDDCYNNAVTLLELARSMNNEMVSGTHLLTYDSVSLPVPDLTSSSFKYKNFLFVLATNPSQFSAISTG